MSKKGNENAPTEMFDDLKWLPPVATTELLPTDGLRDGHVCYVIGEKAIYEWRDGAWVDSRQSG